MPINVRDETAGVLILTIDNNGQMAFGNGTPIDMLTINGYGIIDSNGHIIQGLGSSAAVPASGMTNAIPGQIVTINTIAGRQPNVQVDTRTATSYFIDLRDPSDPTQGGTESVTGLNLPQCIGEPFVGGFILFSNDEYDQFVSDPSGDYYDASIFAPSSQNTVIYRWI